MPEGSKIKAEEDGHHGPLKEKVPRPPRKQSKAWRIQEINCTLGKESSHQFQKIMKTTQIPQADPETHQNNKTQKTKPTVNTKP